MDITFFAGIITNATVFVLIPMVLWGALSRDRRRQFVLLAGAAILGAAILARIAWVVLQPGFTFLE